MNKNHFLAQLVILSNVFFIVACTSNDQTIPCKNMTMDIMNSTDRVTCDPDDN